MDRRERNFDNGTTFNEKEMKISFLHEDDEGFEWEISLPAKFEVCGTCNGKGRHVNPSIDSHGITAEEWENDWDDESREDYFSGAYDVQCNECKGNRVSPVVDEQNANPVHLNWYYDLLSAHRDSEREAAYERKMGY